MKKQVLILLNLILISSVLIAQSPNGFKYQTIIRNTDGTVVKNKTVSIKLSILSGTITGPVVYSESHSLATNDFGLVNLTIGGGTVISGDFSKINWAGGSFFLKTEIDMSGGSSYTTFGTSQILSVPYAKYADVAGSTVKDTYISNSCIYTTSIVPPNGYSYTGDYFFSQVPGFWSAKANLPSVRFECVGATVNNKIYVIGGDNGTGNVNLNQEYDPVTNTWSTKASMPNNRAEMTCQVVNGIVYVIGGAVTGSTPVATVEAYDPVTNTWSTKTSMSTARVELSSAVFNNNIYVFGGYNGGNLNSVEVYNPITDSWTSKTSMPRHSRAHQAIKYDNLIYVIGGYENNYLYTNQVYDPSNDTWTMKTNMVYARADIHVAVVENLIYVIGGSSSSGPVDYTEVYDPVANRWYNYLAIPTARAGGACATWNNSIYIFGGNTSSTGASPTIIVESFSAGKTYYLHCRN